MGARGSTPMLKTGTWRKNRAFTLLELVIVLFIITLFATIAIPRIQVFISHGDTNKAVRQIRGVARYLAGLACSTRVHYHLNYDLSKGTSWVTRRDGGGDFTEHTGALTRSFTLPPGVTFRDVITPRGIHTEGTAYTEFFPTGWIEDTMIHLEGDDVISLKILPITGEIKVYEGYVKEEE